MATPTGAKGGGEITIPGTKKKIPKVAIIAIGGGLMALVLLLKGGKGGGQSRPTGEGTLPDGTTPEAQPSTTSPDMSGFQAQAQAQLDEQAAAFQAFLASLMGQAQNIPPVGMSTPPTPEGVSEFAPVDFGPPVSFPTEAPVLYAAPVVSDVGTAQPVATGTGGARAVAAITSRPASPAVAQPGTVAQRTAERAGLTGNLQRPAAATSPVGVRAAAEAARAVGNVGAAEVNRAQEAVRGVVMSATPATTAASAGRTTQATFAINRPAATPAQQVRPPAAATAPRAASPITASPRAASSVNVPRSSTPSATPARTTSQPVRRAR